MVLAKDIPNIKRLCHKTRGHDYCKRCANKCETVFKFIFMCTTFAEYVFLNG